MKPPRERVPELPEASQETLASYGRETALLNASDAEARRTEQEELKALQARHAEARKTRLETRTRLLQAWIEEPEHERALQALVREGGDRASIRAHQLELEKRLIAHGLTAAEARETVEALLRHPLRASAPTPRRMEQDKTNPVQGGLETVDRVTGTHIVK
jgi:hypothetical protein